MIGVVNREAVTGFGCNQVLVSEIHLLLVLALMRFFDLDETIK